MSVYPLSWQGVGIHCRGRHTFTSYNDGLWGQGDLLRVVREVGRQRRLQVVQRCVQDVKAVHAHLLGHH